MLTLLPHVRPLYISIHERKVGHTQWINGLTLQMSSTFFHALPQMQLNTGTDQR